MPSPLLRIHPFTLSVLLAAFALTSCGDKDEKGTNVTAEGPSPTAETLSAPALDAADVPEDSVTDAKANGLVLSSTAFEEGETIPEKHTGDGADLSPPLSWGEPPEGTQSFALTVEDPDAPTGVWIHWVVYDLPSTTRSLPEGVPLGEAVPGGGKQGVNDFKKDGYGGPKPPPGSPHRYFFKLYALDFVPNLPPGTPKDEFTKAIEGHILAETNLIGTYAR